MKLQSLSISRPRNRGKPMKRPIPVLTLAFFYPFIAEIVFGATPLSRIASLPPLILLYGGGAVFIRELARRAARPWTAILCLGAAYGLVEEGLVMQTFFSPDLFGAAACGARFGSQLGMGRGIARSDER